MSVTGISDVAMREAMNYDWPGNIRELENLVHRSILLSTASIIPTFGHLSEPAGKTAIEKSHLRTIEEVERDHIITVLEKCNWKVYGPGGAAEILGIKVPTLNSRLKKLNIEKVRVKSSNKGLRSHHEG